jgi:hypothetical protein
MGWGGEIIIHAFEISHLILNLIYMKIEFSFNLHEN